MPINPQTGMYEDAVFHTPGPGGNPLVGGLMDAYNAWQGNKLYKENEGDRLVKQLAAYSQHPEIYQNIGSTEQGAQAYQDQGFEPGTVDQTMQGTPAYKYHQALAGTDDYTPQNMLSMAAKNDTDEMVKMYPLVRQQISDEGKNTRERETQHNKAVTEYSENYRKWFDALQKSGAHMDQADQIARERAASSASMTLSEQDIQKAVSQAQQGLQLESSTAPAVQAKITELQSRAGLEDTRAAEIKARTPAEVAALWATVGQKNASAALMKVHESLGKVDLDDRDILNLAKAHALLSSEIQKDESPTQGLTSPMMMLNPEVADSKKAAIAATKPILDQVKQKLNMAIQKKGLQSKTGPNGETWISHDGKNWTNLSTGKTVATE